jgi:hypothetical protein
VLTALTSTTEEGRDLRQNTVFAGVMGQEERREVLLAFIGHDAKT